jgi:alkanesulfonate monooxygenase SsuD/methylene tetrahydromethanopterin reductase-like flavin-dependent oxidoreductase (luciferase family)
MRERILQAAADAGRAPDAITCVCNLEVRIGAKDPDRSVVSGEPEQVLERLRELEEVGFGGMNFIVTGQDAEEQRERLAVEVLPALRATARE